MPVFLMRAGTGRLTPMKDVLYLQAGNICSIELQTGSSHPVREESAVTHQNEWNIQNQTIPMRTKPRRRHPASRVAGQCPPAPRRHPHARQIHMHCCCLIENRAEMDDT